MAEEVQDPIAALNNAKAKEEAEAAGRTANFSESFDPADRQGVMGQSPGRHRLGADEGIRAPFAQDTTEQAQTSVFDGKGNESVVMLGENKNGAPSQGTGPDVASAEAEVASDDNDPGSSFGNLKKE